MLVAAAVLPHPPLLHPAVAGDAASELDELRQACRVAIGTLIESLPDVLLVVGGATEVGIYEPGSGGSFSRFGIDIAVRLPGMLLGEGGARTGGRGAQELPLSLSVAAYLLSAGSVGAPVRAYAVDQRSSSGKAQYLGAELADSFSRVAILAMGDGSACLSAKAPGYIVDGAATWQQQVNAALAASDFAAIAGLTEADADRFWVAGRAAWQVLAGAALSTPVNGSRGVPSQQWVSTTHYASAPYGVQYLAASFRRTGTA